MRRQVLIDTGPLVAFINRRDQFNGWITEELATIKQPLLTCEAVLSEAVFCCEMSTVVRKRLFPSLIPD